jgi:hypothetical protein
VIRRAAHLKGSIAGARALRLEWQRADGGRGSRLHSISPDADLRAVEGFARFEEEDEDPVLAATSIVSLPSTLKVDFTERDDSTGMATVEIVNEGREFFLKPEVRVERWENGRWAAAAAEQCEESEESSVFGKWTTRLSVASTNCVPVPLAPGPYRRVLRLRRYSTSNTAPEEEVQFEQPFSALGSGTSVVMLPSAHSWSLRQAHWSFSTPQLRVGDALVCACDGLVVGRERRVVKLLWSRNAPLRRGLCVAPPDGGVCEEVLFEAWNTGDFPPYFPPK